MHLLPTQDEVVRVLRDTGALRDGHFEYPSGLHSNEYLQVPLAMRYYQHARMLSVGLSRLLRENAEIRAIIPELSIVTPANAGLPVAYGVCEALRARQVYWAEREDTGQPMRFRQFLEQHPGEQVGLVDDPPHSRGTLRRRPADALPPVPGAAPRRTGGAGRRSAALRAQPARDAGTARIARRTRGGAGCHRLSAHPPHPRFRRVAALLSGQAQRQLLRRRRALRSLQGGRAGAKGLGVSGNTILSRR